MVTNENRSGEQAKAPNTKRNSRRERIRRQRRRPWYRRLWRRLSRGWRQLRAWKRGGLIAAMLCMILALVCASLRTIQSTAQADQMAVRAWGGSRRYEQVSVFYPSPAQVKEDTIRELEYNIEQELIHQKLISKKSRMGTDEAAGRRTWLGAYSGLGTCSLQSKNAQAQASAIGVGGDFFFFHPLQLISGAYFSASSLMQDQILIDENTAWRLFGSNDVIGQQVLIGGAPHYVAGVFSRESGFFASSADTASNLIFLSYKSLLQFTQQPGTGSGSDPGSGSTTDQNDDGSGEVQGRITLPAPALPVLLAEPAEAVQESPAEGEATEPADAGQSAAGQESTQVQTTEDAGTPDTAEPGTEEVGGAQSAEVADTGSTAAATENPGGSSAADSDALPEGTGTTNTQVTDSGRIIALELLLPGPVSGYAAQLVSEKSGAASIGAVIVDNTARYRAGHLWKDLASLPTRAMRTTEVRFPYWENMARAREDVCAVLLLLEVLLLVWPVLYVVLLLISAYRGRRWTAASLAQRVSDEIYAYQSMRRYGPRKQRRGLQLHRKKELPQDDGAQEQSSEATVIPAADPEQEQFLEPQQKEGTEEAEGTEETEEAEGTEEAEPAMSQGDATRSAQETGEPDDGTAFRDPFLRDLGEEGAEELHRQEPEADAEQQEQAEQSSAGQPEESSRRSFLDVLLRRDVPFPEPEDPFAGMFDEDEEEQK